MPESDNIDPDKVAKSTEAINLNKEALEKFLEVMGKASKEVGEFDDALDKLTEAQRDAQDTGESLNSTLSGLLGSSSGFSKGIINLTKSIGESDSFFKGFTKSMTLANAQFMALSAALNLVEKGFEATAMLVKDTDAALTSFQKQTGALDLYGSKITAV